MCVYVLCVRVCVCLCVYVCVSVCVHASCVPGSVVILVSMLTHVVDADMLHSVLVHNMFAGHAA